MPDSLSGKYRFWRYRIFALTWIAYGAFYLCRKNFSIAMPLLTRDLGYTKGDFADILFFYSLFYALGQFYSGFLADRLGPRFVVGAGLLLSAFANLVMGISSAFIVLAVLLCVNGAAQSTGWSGTVKNMTPWFRPRERGVVMAWWSTCYVVGGIVATAFATYLVTHPLFFRAEDVRDPTRLAVELKKAADPLSRRLKESFSEETKRLLSEYREGTEPAPALREALARELNEVIKGPFLYDEKLFAHVRLTEATRKALERIRKGGEKVEGKDLLRFNKTFLLEAYPGTLAVGWRKGFWGPALVVIFLALLYVAFVRNKPTDVGLEPIEAEPEKKSGEAEDENASAESPLRVLSNPIVWLIGGMYFCTKMGRYALLFWLPLYMTQHLGYNEAEAGYTSTLYEVFGFAGVIAAGYVSDKLFRGRRMPVGALGMWALAAVCLLHPSLAASSRLGNMIGISLMGFFTYGPDSLMSGAAAMDVGSQKAAGLAAGIINGCGSLGQMLSGFLVAGISTAFGWDTLFFFLAVPAVLGGILVAFRWNWLPPSEKDES